MSAPVWNRDYFYLNGKLQVVRDYMKENCVHTVAEELLSLALDIFSRFVTWSLNYYCDLICAITGMTTDEGWGWR